MMRSRAADRSGVLVFGRVIDFDDVRAMAVALPGVEEAPWYGAPAFRVRGPVFARLHENDADLILLKVGRDERDALVADQPARFLTTAHRSESEESVLMRLSASTATDLPELRGARRNGVATDRTASTSTRTRQLSPRPPLATRRSGPACINVRGDSRARVRR